MSDEKSSRRSASRKTAGKSAAKHIRARKKSKPFKDTTEKETPLQKLDRAIVHLEDFGDTLNRTSNNSGVHNSNYEPQDNIDPVRNRLSSVAGKIKSFTTGTADIARLKLELHNLRKNRDNYLLLTGERVRNMYRSNNLRNIRSKLKDDFESLDKVEKLIEEKERELRRLSDDMRIFR